LKPELLPAAWVVLIRGHPYPDLKGIETKGRSLLPFRLILWPPLPLSEAD